MVICCLLALALCLSAPALAYDNSGVYGVVQQGNLATFAQNIPASTIEMDASVMTNLSNAVFTSLNPDFRIDTVNNSDHIHTYNCACYFGTVLRNADNYIPGDCFQYLYRNAAKLGDGTRAHVLITYSDVHIYTPTPTHPRYDEDGGVYTGPTACAQGRTIRVANASKMHIGLRQTINIRIVDDAGDPVDGTFYFNMNDIDVRRDGNNNYTRLYQAALYDNFSEHIKLLSGAVSDAYVPQASGYKLRIENDGTNDHANGLTFIPTQDDNDTFNSGFVVLADAVGGITLTSCASAGGGYNSGGSFVRNKVDSFLLVDLPIYPITVSKTVTGSLGDRSREWTFTLTLKNADGSPVTDLKQPAGAQNWNDSDKTSGNYTFTLRHGESLTIPSLAGKTKYQLTEANPDGYRQSYTLNGGVSQKSGSTGQRSLTESAAVAYTNNLDTPIPTGVSDSVAPAIVLIALSALLLPALLLGRRRRGHD